jgi:hypothetical protein
MDAAGVVQKFGVTPESIPDYLALLGDAADGYPGLAGWGAKSSAAVLAKFLHLEHREPRWRAVILLLATAAIVYTFYKQVHPKPAFPYDRFPYLIDQTSYSKVLLRGDYLPVDRPLAVFRVNDTQWSVALVDEQSTQAKAYHAWCREQAPDVISAADVRLGDRRAELMALARRGYYALNARRMRAAR